jgi:hypothetical protein
MGVVLLPLQQRVTRTRVDAPARQLPVVVTNVTKLSRVYALDKAMYPAALQLLKQGSSILPALCYFYCATTCYNALMKPRCQLAVEWLLHVCREVPLQQRMSHVNLVFLLPLLRMAAEATAWLHCYCIQ